MAEAARSPPASALTSLRSHIRIRNVSSQYRHGLRVASWQMVCPARRPRPHKTPDDSLGLDGYTTWRDARSSGTAREARNAHGSQRTASPMPLPCRVVTQVAPSARRQRRPTCGAVKRRGNDQCSRSMGRSHSSPRCHAASTSGSGRSVLSTKRPSGKTRQDKRRQSHSA